jgi:hypothetical protein
MAPTKEQKKAYDKAYYKSHKEEFAKRNKKYRVEHIEQDRASSRKWHMEHKEKANARRAKWQREHIMETRAQSARWRKKNRDKNKIRHAKYRKEHPSYFRLWRQTPNGKTSMRKTKAGRNRQLGYNILLPLKQGEIGHHVTNKDVIGVPEQIHQQLSGHSRKKHRTLVLQWLKENDKRKYNLALCALASVRPILPL